MITVILIGLLYGIVAAETAVNGIKASNVLGGSEQHASFSFIRPGLTQTSYAFNGPSSHQSFSSSIGNPHLAQKVLPNVANALAYRNPGLGYYSTAPVSTGYANFPYVHPTGVPIDSSSHLAPSVAGSSYNQQQKSQVDQATALAYLQQYYQHNHQSRIAQPLMHQQMYIMPENNEYQYQLGQIFALRQQQALLQLQAHNQHQETQGQTSTSEHIPVHETSQEVPEQVRLEQQVHQQTGQNLLGVAYSSAPSVAHVKVTGNGYKFNF